MSEPLTIQSHIGPYTVAFYASALERLAARAGRHFIVDARVAELYAADLASVLADPGTLVVEAVEANKSLERMPGYVERLVAGGVRRGHTLYAVGGGIIQDITCFLAATLLRGLPWVFYPTTLLAQADSCIGSKSSINVGALKNIVGTFTPPAEVVITSRVLATLEPREICSGLGEMLKVHALAGPAEFDRLAGDYPRLLADPAARQRYIRRSLEIKQGFIEHDEFDRGPRQLLNYGHSFGHAIESATAFAIPHGIAVTLGMDLANYVAWQLGRLAEAAYRRMHPALAANYAICAASDIPLDGMLAALAKDKKNTDAQLTLILLGARAEAEKVSVSADAAFRQICADYLARERGR